MTDTRVQKKSSAQGEENGFVQSGKLTWLAVGVLASAVVTGSTSWLVFGVDKVTRDEMQKYVSEQSPFARAQGRVALQIETNASHIAENARSVKEMNAALRQFFQEQVKAQVKLEAAIEVLKHAIEAKK